MFYVSRRLNRNRVEIIDTDDGVAEEYTLREVADICRKGIKIEGCTYNEETRFFSVVPVTINHTIQETKLKVLKGLDLQINDGVLLSFGISGTLKNDITIRLSDFCHTIDRCFVNPARFTDGLNNHKLVVILDDKLRINENAFSMVYYTSKIIWNIKDLSRGFRQLYQQFIAYGHFDVDYADDYIIDSEDRKNYFLGESILINGYYALKHRDFETDKDFKVDHPEIYKYAQKLTNAHKRKLDNLVTKFRKYYTGLIDLEVDAPLRGYFNKFKDFGSDSDFICPKMLEFIQYVFRYGGRNSAVEISYLLNYIWYLGVDEKICSTFNAECYEFVHVIGKFIEADDATYRR